MNKYKKGTDICRERQKALLKNFFEASIQTRKIYKQKKIDASKYNMYSM